MRSRAGAPRSSGCCAGPSSARANPHPRGIGVEGLDPFARGACGHRRPHRGPRRLRDRSGRRRRRPGSRLARWLSAEPASRSRTPALARRSAARATTRCARHGAPRGTVAARPRRAGFIRFTAMRAKRYAALTISRVPSGPHGSARCATRPCGPRWRRPSPASPLARARRAADHRPAHGLARQRAHARSSSTGARWPSGSLDRRRALPQQPAARLGRPRSPCTTRAPSSTRSPRTRGPAGAVARVPRRHRRRRRAGSARARPRTRRAGAGRGRADRSSQPRSRRAPVRPPRRPPRRARRPGPLQAVVRRINLVDPPDVLETDRALHARALAAYAASTPAARRSDARPRRYSPSWPRPVHPGPTERPHEPAAAASRGSSRFRRRGAAGPASFNRLSDRDH